ncbi:cytochrome P450 CYP72A219-like isoform X2 [Salvia splendens]|uniref:cytochrome P450 CYP72A219-like isoform X1 n=1 Tax=Salvia splendens TaxID=180675 RepID=UPI001C27D030|nr:cytochrome P450 CYP72A219-like isoform X1 [Salvia splendens]XP_042005055.1 cytochrome P450 CYP72A219-like isoform X2 [Salvia splendens]
MDNFTCSLALSSAIVALVYVTSKFLTWIWIRPKKLEIFLRQQGFHGNSYKLFHGDSADIKGATREAMSKPINFSNDIFPRASPVYHKAVQKYGEKCFVWFGPRPAVVISDPELFREIMSKNYVFQKPHSLPVKRLIARGLVSLEADKWSKHRKLINPAFHVDKLKHLVPSFYLSCGEMLSKWDEIMGNEGCGEVDVWPHLHTMTSDVISRTAFGSSYEEGRKISHLQSEQAMCSVGADRSVNIPGYRFLPTKVNMKVKQNRKEIESLVLGIINKRMKATESGEDHHDLLGLLLQSNSKEMKQGNEFGMSINEVIEECKIFYFAGHETTATLLVWTMILLSNHDDWQGRARDEVLQAFGRGKPDYKQLNNLKIVTMILHEVLRLYPPAAMLSRCIQKEITVGEKVRLPAGVELMFPVIMLHQDPRIWGDDAKEFKPERFGDGVSKAGAREEQAAYFPFGWGPRICIGQNFAMLEAKMAIAMILQRYSFRLSPSYSHAPRVVITLQPEHGARLILTKLER